MRSFTNVGITRLKADGKTTKRMASAWVRSMLQAA
jgi:hypothetical protein